MKQTNPTKPTNKLTGRMIDAMTERERQELEKKKGDGSEFRRLRRAFLGHFLL